MSIVGNDNSDILWIDTNLPIIATIYYHIYLNNNKYTLYCPDNTFTTTNDSTMEPQHVRDLVRSILKVVDMNSHKKLALYFLKPISSTKREDFLRFLHKRRPNLNISFLTLSYDPMQQYTLSGWIYTLNKNDFPLWFNQCLILQPSLPPPNSITLDNVYIDHNLNQPFLVTANPFIKKAFIVDICSNMIQITDDKIEFNSSTINAINGYMDAVISSEQGSTIILIGHECTFFTNNEHFIIQQSDDQQIKQLIESKRKKIWEWIESLATSFPIYLFLIEYNKLNNQKLHQSLAWLHHRHHLSIPKSIILTWEAFEFDSTCPIFLTQIHSMNLLSTARFTRSKWKSDFILILNEIEGKSTSEEQLRILPSKLNITDSENWIAPLYEPRSPFMKTKLEHNDSFIHSVSSLTEEIALDWKNKNYENWIQYQKKNKNDSVREDIINEEEMDNEKLEAILLNVNHEVVISYIANSGAYSRGEKLLGTLNCLSYSWNEDGNLLLFTKAQGTSNVPYNVYICINRHIRDNQVIKNGFCSCPVGKNGRCKHCTALLLRFIINMDEFDQSKEPIVLPNIDDHFTSTISETKDNNNKNKLQLVILTSMNQDTNNNLATQTSDQNDKDVQREKRRVLPWVLGKNKLNEEEEFGNNEQEENNNNKEKDDKNPSPRKKKQKTNTKKTPKKSESIKNDITASTSSDNSLQIVSNTVNETKNKNENNKSKNENKNHKSKNKNKNKNDELESSNSNSDDFNISNNQFRDVFINPKNIPSAKQTERKTRNKKEVKKKNPSSHSPISITDHSMIENLSPLSSIPPSQSLSTSFNKSINEHHKQSSMLSYSPLIDFEEKKEYQKDILSPSTTDEPYKYKNSNISFSFLSMDEDIISTSTSSPSSPSSKKDYMNQHKISPNISFSSLKNDKKNENQKNISSSFTVNDPYKYRSSDVSFSFLSMDEEASSSLLSDPVPQGSTLSLPLTDLALSNQAQIIDGDDDDDDTVDEEYEKILEEQKQKSIPLQNNNNNNNNNNNGLNDTMKMSTSDLFDELGL